MTRPSPSHGPDRPALLRDVVRWAPLVSAVAGLAGGGLAFASGRPDVAAWIWTTGTVPVLLLLAREIVVRLRNGDVGLDLVAALAMASALAVGEFLAAAVVALMFAGGQGLEAFAKGRASRDMTALLDKAPRSANRYEHATLATIAADDVEVGDRLLVRLGERLPVDGIVSGSPALVDQAAMTGESLPVTRQPGETAMSGSTNVGPAFDLTATRKAADSTYAGIVRLVEEASRSQAPMVRLADRYALGFTLATLVVSGLAWVLAGDPVRAVAVLVVATPCPLILAVPVAIVAGISRAARLGVLVKGGTALETLGRIRTLVIDKTGTLTHGTASVSSIVVTGSGGEDEVLRLAASLDQASQHAIARAIVAAASVRQLSLDLPKDSEETAGEGVEGWLGQRQARVGGVGYVSKALEEGDRSTLARIVPAGEMGVALAVDGRLAGAVLLRDALRPGAGATLDRLRGEGVKRVVLATGDRRDVALAVTQSLALDEIAADLGPADKIDLVRCEKANGPVMMVGDGVNDAPALIEADLGVAMGAKGAAASAQAADVILLRDSLEGLADAMQIARRSRRIALESVYAGIGLSGIAMVFAAVGYLPPVRGALLQEAIDVAVVLNALRALGRGRRRSDEEPNVGPSAVDPPRLLDTASPLSRQN